MRNQNPLIEAFKASAPSSKPAAAATTTQRIAAAILAHAGPKSKPGPLARTILRGC
jgi:hypothetical protein